MKFFKYFFFFVAVVFFIFVLNRDSFRPSSCQFEKQLKIAAYKNIEGLSSEKRASYRQLMQKHSDVLIYFLLASEEQYKLELAEPQIIACHYREIKEKHWGLKEKYGLEFFLAYVAKVTVTDEQITPYRRLFKEYGLYRLKEIPDIYQKVRELNLWCRKFISFRATSGRHQTPQDIIEKSNLGRCEEMLIFFISAARSLGIPARPAYAPLWAHTDGNHAWVEVFVEGKWQYLGAAEPSYHLNRAWFSSNLGKVPLVLARSFSPAPSEKELFRSGLISVVNSTPNYAKIDEQSVRGITFEAYCSEGKPLKNVDILPHVFNRGKLRPLLRLNTEDSNKLEVNFGAGSFLVVAAQNSIYGMADVSYGYQDKTVELVLDEGFEPAAWRFLYPGKKDSVSQPVPDFWEKRVEEARAAYEQKIQNYPELPEEGFEVIGEEVEGVWERFRNNALVFEAFLLKYGREKDFFHYLTLIDEKFLWQCSLKQLENLYQLYQDLSEARLDYPEEVMAVILQPGVYLEELSTRPLGEKFLKWRDYQPQRAVLAINKYLKNNYKIDSDQAIDGLLPVDKMVERKYLTSNQHKVFLISLLRHNFIPAAFPEEEEAVFVLIDGEIRIFNFRENEFVDFPHERELPAVELNLIFQNCRKEPVKPRLNQFSLTRYHRGSFSLYPVNFEFKDYRFQASLAEGEFYLHTGYRVSEKETKFQLVKINTREKEKLEKIVELAGYPVAWEGLPEDFQQFKLIALRQKEEKPKNNKIFLFGDYGREPVQRLAERAKALIDSENFYWIGGRSYPDVPPEYEVDPDYAGFLEEMPAFKNALITLYYDAETKDWVFYQGTWDSLPEGR